MLSGMWSLILVFSSLLMSSSYAMQSWVEQPAYQEVNPGGHVVLSCVIRDREGHCQWEKDGQPVGMFEAKYEWAGQPDLGDCSIRVLDAQLDYDDGIWKCQVTPSNFKAKDALTSDGAQLVVRVPPGSVTISASSMSSMSMSTRATKATEGERLSLSCLVRGANPAASVVWLSNGHEMDIEATEKQERFTKSQLATWTTTSTLDLIVDREDDNAIIECVAKHPALNNRRLANHTTLTVHYPPEVRVESSSLSELEEQRDSVSLRCVVDSKPESHVLWKKENEIVGKGSELIFSPVTREAAGLYTCTAENELGKSRSTPLQITVQYSPVIRSVGPSSVVSVAHNSVAELWCLAEGEPVPRFQWLQKLPSHQVLIRGDRSRLVLSNVSYEHQGEYVCQALNRINEEERSVQSESILVEVSGPPEVLSEERREVRVANGEDAVLQVLFCADPIPRQTWYLGDLGSGSGNELILAAGTGHGRFVARSLQSIPKEDCYMAVLDIEKVRPADAHDYRLRLVNEHGQDGHVVTLVVVDHVSQETLAAVFVAAVATFMLLAICALFCCRRRPKHRQEMLDNNNACNTNNAMMKETLKTDIDSDRTWMESEQTSERTSVSSPSVSPFVPLYNNMSNNTSSNTSNKGVLATDQVVIPPDALYFKRGSDGAASGAAGVVGPPVHFHDLCFPKTSNYGSMRKKNEDEKLMLSNTLSPKNNVGVVCRLNHTG